MPSPLPLPASLFNDVQIDSKSPTGLSWKRRVANCTQIGAPCGGKTAKGYLAFMYKSKTYKVHRVVYFLYTGQDPGSLQIDHIDGDVTNNLPHNLRLADNGQNQANTCGQTKRKCKYKGVTMSKSGRYIAQCKQRGKINKYIGIFDTEDEAAKAYDRVALAEFGEFAFLNFTA